MKVKYIVEGTLKNGSVVYLAAVLDEGYEWVVNIEDAHKFSSSEQAYRLGFDWHEHGLDRDNPMIGAMVLKLQTQVLNWDTIFDHKAARRESIQRQIAALEAELATL